MGKQVNPEPKLPPLCPMCKVPLHDENTAMLEGVNATALDVLHRPWCAECYREVRGLKLAGAYLGAAVVPESEQSSASCKRSSQRRKPGARAASTRGAPC